MPQPFKRRGRVMTMSPATVAEDPGFAVLIALVGSHWNQIEFNLATMYTWLLLGQEPAAFEFYHDLVDLSLREKAFSAAARGRLSAPLIVEVTQFYVDIRKLAKRRAKIIHGVWARLPSKPLSLFLCDPAGVNRQLNEMLRYVRDVQKDRSKIKPTVSFDLLPEEFEEYHARDFQTLMNDLTAAINRSTELGNKVLAEAMALPPK